MPLQPENAMAGIDMRLMFKAVPGMHQWPSSWANVNMLSRDFYSLAVQTADQDMLPRNRRGGLPGFRVRRSSAFHALFQNLDIFRTKRCQPGRDRFGFLERHFDVYTLDNRGIGSYMCRSHSPAPLCADAHSDASDYDHAVSIRRS